MARLSKIAGSVIIVGFACSPTGALEQRAPSESSGSTPLPCAVAQILEQRCHDCHGAKPKYGAPMALVTYEDVHRASASHRSQQVYQRIGVRINDEADPMPPPPDSLTAAEYDVLTAWVGAGAPRGEACGAGGEGGAGAGTGVGGTGGGPNTGGVGGGMGGVGGGGVGGVGGDGGSGGGVINPGECTPIHFLSHGQQAPNDSSPFHVTENAQNLYQCFYFKAPWDQPTQALSFKPVIDNEEVLHHWLLYSTTTAYTDGSSAPCFGVHTDGELLAGWAPRAGEWIMPNGVGMQLPAGPNAYLVLEVHYYNGARAPGMYDRSGVEVCATQNLRPNTATVSWLGTEAILLPGYFQGDVTGTCTPAHNGPIHIIRSWPHMHTLGRNMKIDIIRANGPTETLHNQPFDFDYQYSYETPATINPGDRIVTTCTYHNTTPNAVRFGPETESEMCYNFAIAYPANALKSALPGLHQRSCTN